ncbi:hypothetical protein HELRODRAFT_178034 [Helobdella robusta]|uniref:Uncharacterized protein n=1 Tax=Helobdella robusta TaxID=6412 RepID=T1FCN1_HELRO|nr:hypothetical protein HELRODRAFT_178034 [Helobdella robusta]ESN97598.1 hypothetical protein HELRODRAFT_178034 [Helobdella robusta]
MSIIITHNFIVFVMVMRVLCRDKSHLHKSAEKKDIKSRLMGAFTLLVLLGIPWILSAFGAIKNDVNDSVKNFQSVIGEGMCPHAGANATDDFDRDARVDGKKESSYRNDEDDDENEKKVFENISEVVLFCYMYLHADLSANSPVFIDNDSNGNNSYNDFDATLTNYSTLDDYFDKKLVVTRVKDYINIY